MIILRNTQRLDLSDFFRRWIDCIDPAAAGWLGYLLEPIITVFIDRYHNPLLHQGQLPWCVKVNQGGLLELLNGSSS